jgi:hypothetical protein
MMNYDHETEGIQDADYKVSRENRRKKNEKKKSKSFKKALNFMKYQLEDF